MCLAQIARIAMDATRAARHPLPRASSVGSCTNQAVSAARSDPRPHSPAVETRRATTAPSRRGTAPVSVRGCRTTRSRPVPATAGRRPGLARARERPAGASEISARPYPSRCCPCRRQSPTAPTSCSGRLRSSSCARLRSAAVASSSPAYRLSATCTATKSRNGPVPSTDATYGNASNAVPTHSATRMVAGAAGAVALGLWAVVELHRLHF